MPEPVTAISTEELLREQQEAPLCASIREGINRGEKMPFVHSPDSGLLVRSVSLLPQVVVPVSLRTRVLSNAHVPRTSGHPGGRKMYVTLRR